MTTAPARTDRRTDRRLLRLGGALAALMGLVHLVEAPEYLQQSAVVGVLFIVGGVGTLAAAVVLLTTRFAALRRPAVLLTALASLLMIVLGVLSRTTGLGSFREDEWELLLIVSFVLEAAFLALTPRLLAATAGR